MRLRVSERCQIKAKRQQRAKYKKEMNPCVEFLEPALRESVGLLALQGQLKH